MNDAPLLSSLTLSLFPLADSVYKAFDSTTAVSARCGHTAGVMRSCVRGILCFTTLTTVSNLIYSPLCFISALLAYMQLMGCISLKKKT